MWKHTCGLLVIEQSNDSSVASVLTTGDDAKSAALGCGGADAMAGSDPVTPARVLYRKENYGLCIGQTGEAADAYQTVWKSAEAPERKKSCGGMHETVHNQTKI